jgi:hypothetical protein
MFFLKTASGASPSSLSSTSSPPSLPSSTASVSSVVSSACTIYSFDSLLQAIPVSEEELVCLLPSVGAMVMRISKQSSVSSRSVIQFPKERVIEGFQFLFEEMIARNWKKSVSLSKKEYLSALLLVSPHQISPELVDFLFSLLLSNSSNDDDLVEVNVERVAKISGFLLLNQQKEKVRAIVNLTVHQFSLFFSVSSFSLLFHRILLLF